MFATGPLARSTIRGRWLIVRRLLVATLGIVLACSLTANWYLASSSMHQSHCKDLYQWFLENSWGQPPSSDSLPEHHQKNYDLWFSKCVTQAPSQARDKRQRAREVVSRLVKLKEEQRRLIDQLQERILERDHQADRLLTLFHDFLARSMELRKDEEEQLSQWQTQLGKLEREQQKQLQAALPRLPDSSIAAEEYTTSPDAEAELKRLQVEWNKHA